MIHLRTLIEGIISGGVATVPMTVFMEKAFHALPPSKQYPLPPREITENMTQKAGVDDALNDQQTYALTMASHFSYGSLMGGVYSLLPFHKKRNNLIRSVSQGALFGLGVWGVSYLGILPRLHLLASAENIPKERNALMVMAHILWGASLGLTFSQLDSLVSQPGRLDNLTKTHS